MLSMHNSTACASHLGGGGRGDGEGGGGRGEGLGGKGWGLGGGGDLHDMQGTSQDGVIRCQQMHCNVPASRRMPLPAGGAQPTSTEWPALLRAHRLASGAVGGAGAAGTGQCGREALSGAEGMAGSLALSSSCAAVLC